MSIESKDEETAIKAIIREHVRKNTPLPGNICHDDEGEVVKRVTSLFRGRFGYSLPVCSVCGRVYLFSKDVRQVGVQEFLKLLEQVYF